jgi:hypothetical protein
MVRALLTAAVLFVWAAPLSGCVTGEPSSIFIVGNGTLDDDCIIQEDPVRTLGILDVRVRSHYVVDAVVWNQLRRRSNHVGADPNGVQLHTAEVAVLRGDGATLAGPFDIPTSGFIPSAADADSQGVGFATVAVPVGSASPGLAHVSIRLFGTTNGELDVSTGEWLYLIELCDGCMVCQPGQEPSGCGRVGQDGFCYEPVE